MTTSLRYGLILRCLTFSASSLLPIAPAAATQQCSVTLLPAYAHNDYRNQWPLQDALALGYQGVEADYVLVGGELLVAHGRGDALRGHTIERLYLAPLRERFRRCGWIHPEQQFLLTIEYKERRPEGYRALRELLAQYLDIIGAAQSPGPVQVILVGWHPPLREMAGDSLPIKVQGRLTRTGLSVPQGNTAMVGLLSLDYGKNLRWRGRGALSREDQQTLEHIRRVRQLLPGRLIRAYNVPADLRVYRLLLSSGVDLIGVKELKEMAGILRSLESGDPPE